LTVDEARRLIIEASRTRHEALLTVMLAYGLRRVEARGLHWSALDWDAATLKVTHGVKQVQDRTASHRHTRLVVGELKTARSRRTLLLTPQLINLLRQHRARLAEERIAIVRCGVTTGLIFPSQAGTPATPTTSRMCSRGSHVAPVLVTGMCPSYDTQERH
jgi:integrase